MRPLIVGTPAKTLVRLNFNDGFRDLSPYNREVTEYRSPATATATPVGAEFGAYANFLGAGPTSNTFISVAGAGLSDALQKNWTIEYYAINTSLVFPPTTWNRGAYHFNIGDLFSSFCSRPNPIFGLGVIWSVYASDSGGVAFLFSASIADDTDWHHYQIERDGDVIRARFDGVEVGSAVLAEPITQAEADLVLGTYYAGGAVNTPDGNVRMDEFRMQPRLEYVGDFTPPGPHKR